MLAKATAWLSIWMRVPHLFVFDCTNVPMYSKLFNSLVLLPAAWKAYLSARIMASVFHRQHIIHQSGHSSSSCKLQAASDDSRRTCTKSPPFYWQSMQPFMLVRYDSVVKVCTCRCRQNDKKKTRQEAHAAASFVLFVYVCRVCVCVCVCVVCLSLSLCLVYVCSWIKWVSESAVYNPNPSLASRCRHVLPL